MSERMIDAIAHILTGHINGVCCHKTGGTLLASRCVPCECRDIAREIVQKIISGDFERSEAVTEGNANE